MLGNNIKSNKVKRILVPLTGNITTGRYYLPENPELEKYTITGIQISIGSSGAYPYGDVTRNTPYTEGSNSVQNTVNPKRGFLTLYSEDGSELASNFPVYGFFNRNNSSISRIMPILGKVDIRRSFIFYPGRFANLPGVTQVLWINFFYI